MSDEKKPTRFLGTLAELFRDVRLMMALVVGLVVAGAVSATRFDASVRTTAIEAVEPALARQSIRIDAAAAVAQRALEVAQQSREDFAELKQDVRGSREDFRLREKGKPLPPLPPLDGGTH